MLITFVGEIPAPGGTTALLLLGVFTVVNVAVLVLRKDPVSHAHFRTPPVVPVLGAISCAFLVGPWTGRDPQQCRIAGVLLAIGAVLWVVTILVNRATGVKPVEPAIQDFSGHGPKN
jgi:basic amino acid/polyamine antiporter, APA family